MMHNQGENTEAGLDKDTLELLKHPATKKCLQSLINEQEEKERRKRRQQKELEDFNHYVSFCLANGNPKDYVIGTDFDSYLRTETNFPNLHTLYFSLTYGFLGGSIILFLYSALVYIVSPTSPDLVILLFLAGGTGLVGLICLPYSLMVLRDYRRFARNEFQSKIEEFQRYQQKIKAKLASKEKNQQT